MMHLVHVKRCGEVIAEREFYNKPDADRWIEIFEENMLDPNHTAVYVGEIERTYDDTTLRQWVKQ